jgi:hypothetical protein
MTRSPPIPGATPKELTMSTLSVAVTVAAAAVGLTLVVAAVLPARYELSRSRVIAAPAPALSALVADFSRRTDWIPWAVTEPAADFRVAGTAGSIGSRFSWDGKTIGAGSATLTQHQSGHIVETALQFERPMTMTARDRITFESLPGGQTRVTWTNDGKLAYPIGRLFGLVIDRVVGAEYEAGLVRLESAATVNAVATAQ